MNKFKDALKMNLPDKKKQRSVKSSKISKHSETVVLLEQRVVRDVLKRPEVRGNQRCEMFKEYVNAQVFRALKSF